MQNTTNEVKLPKGQLLANVDAVYVDAMFECHRAIHKFPRFSTKDGSLKTGMPFGFLRAINSYRKLFGTNRIIVVWDGWNPKRKELISSYKEGRAKKDESFGQQMSLVKEALSAMGVKQIMDPELEADDMLALQATMDDRAVIVTGDDDLLQVVGNSVYVYNPTYKVLYTPEKVEEKYGVKPTRLALLWAIQGDPSDGIDGVPGIGAAAVKLVEKADASTVEGFYDKLVLAAALADVGHAKVGLLEEYRPLVERNYQAILLDPALIDSEDLQLNEGDKSEEKFTEFCKKIESNSFLKSISEYMSFE